MTIIKLIFRLLLIIAIPIGVAVITYYYISSELLAAANPEEKEMVSFEISPGTTFSALAQDLEGRGLLKNAFSLTLLARFKKIDTSVKAGEYELSPSMTPEVILKILQTGKMKIREILVPEGYTAMAIADVVEKAGLTSRQEFIEASSSPALLAKAGISSSNFEGYLFPETYQFSRPIKAEQIVWKMFSEADKRWSKTYQQMADSLRLSRHEIVTLASIIEKESGNKDEYAIISSVFYNRLKLGMRLQSDPTVIYGIPNFNGNLTKADLQIPHAHNTYVNFGLPPGPICNPGEQALLAALSPAETDYLYFVGDNTGKHIFSKTLEEHNLAVNTYQRKGISRTETSSGSSAAASNLATAKR